MDLSTFVQKLRANADDGPGTVDAWHQVEPQAARMQALPEWLHPGLVDALQARGILELFSHQRECADLLHDHKHAVISTSTASASAAPIARNTRGKALSKVRRATCSSRMARRMLATRCSPAAARISEWKISATLRPTMRRAYCTGMRRERKQRTLPTTRRSSCMPMLRKRKT